MLGSHYSKAILIFFCNPRFAGQRAIDEVQQKLRSRGYGEVSHMVEFFGVAPGDTAPPPAAPATA